jgi:hypothetical protein
LREPAKRVGKGRVSRVDRKVKASSSAGAY